MKSAVLLLTCKNAPRVTQLTDTQVSRVMSQVSAFYLQQSGGREQLEFRVFDWFGLSLTSQAWDNLGFNVGPVVTQEVAAGLNVDLSPYNHFVLVIDKAGARLAASDPTLKYCHAAAANLTQAILGHEFGHTYGAQHANLYSPTGPIEYGDNFCIMGLEGSKYSFTDPALGNQGASGPGMVAPTLIACGWLDIKDGALAFDVGRRSKSRRNEPVCELKATRGAPPAGGAELPVVARADNAVGEQHLLVEFRMRDGWDRALPASGSSVGWMVGHLTNGVTPHATSVQIGSVPANVGTRLDLLVAMTYVTVAAVDSARGTIRLQVDTPWFANPPAVAAWQKDRLDIFGLGSDWQMYHKAWAAAAWDPPTPLWEALGGSFISPPAVVSWGPSRVDVFGLGRDRSLYHKAWDGNHWYPSPMEWEPLGGVFTAPPAVASWGPNRLDIFGVGADYAMFHKAWDGHSWYPSPSDWQSLGGGFSSPPSVVSWGPDRLDIVALGFEGGMYHKAWDGRGWYPSVDTWEPLGGEFTSPPTAVSWGINRLDIFGLGTDSAMYHKAWDGRVWYPSPDDWELLGGGFSLPPTAVSWGPNRLDILGIGNDHAMYHKAWDGRNWYPPAPDWESLGGCFISQPSVASWGQDRLDVFGCGTDKAMYHRGWDSNAWLPWENIGGRFA